MQQSRNLIPRQAKNQKTLCHCATVPLRHCVMSAQLNNFFLKFLKKNRGKSCFVSLFSVSLYRDI